MVCMVARCYTAEARTKVYDSDELKQALRTDGQDTIEVMDIINVRETLTVKGTKVLKGPGEIRRAITSDSAFGGTLIKLTSGSLTLKSISINGRGESGVLRGKLYGWLVQVSGGQLNICDGTVLKMNQNTARKSDGGGAVRVSGGSCVMSGGLITGNTCITGGAGVRVDGGGTFYMNGGRITGNKVVGAGAVEGFDGRGGAIYNKGTTAISGGEILGNTVTGYKSGVKSYGGVGGGIANAGDLLVKGGVISGNTGTRGRDVGQIRGRVAGSGTVHIGELWLKSGQVFHVGSGFAASSKITINPEKVNDGVKLVEGISKKAADKYFTCGKYISKSKWQLVVSNNLLQIKKKSAPTPAPTKPPGSGGVGGSSGGQAGAGGYGESNGGNSSGDRGGSRGNSGENSDGTTPPAATRRPTPSYIPVATLDPYAPIGIYTYSPSPTLQSAVPRLAMPPIPYLTPPARTPSPTPVPTPATYRTPPAVISTYTTQPTPMPHINPPILSTATTEQAVDAVSSQHFPRDMTASDPATEYDRPSIIVYHFTSAEIAGWHKILNENEDGQTGVTSSATSDISMVISKEPRRNDYWKDFISQIKSNQERGE